MRTTRLSIRAKLRRQCKLLTKSEETSGVAAQDFSSVFPSNAAVLINAVVRPREYSIFFATLQHAPYLDCFRSSGFGLFVNLFGSQSGRGECGGLVGSVTVVSTRIPMTTQFITSRHCPSRENTSGQNIAGRLVLSIELVIVRRSCQW